MNATTKIGLSPTEYNALVHAIWRIDQLINNEILTDEQRERLQRDRRALQALFVRLS
jgi:uncharacterized membrane protein YqjE